MLPKFLQFPFRNSLQGLRSALGLEFSWEYLQRSPYLAEKEGTMKICRKLRQKCYEDSSDFPYLWLHFSNIGNNEEPISWYCICMKIIEHMISANPTSQRPPVFSWWDQLLFKSKHVLYCSLSDNRNHDVPWSAQKNWYTCNCNMNPISRNIKPKHVKPSSHLNRDHVATIQLIVEIG